MQAKIRRRRRSAWPDHRQTQMRTFITPCAQQCRLRKKSLTRQIPPFRAAQAAIDFDGTLTARLEVAPFQNQLDGDSTCAVSSAMMGILAPGRITSLTTRILERVMQNYPVRRAESKFNISRNPWRIRCISAGACVGNGIAPWAFSVFDSERSCWRAPTIVNPCS